MHVPTSKLPGDVAIPQVGLGLWKVKDQTEFNRTFTAAYDAGYRHFDTAQVYGNEAFLGEAWHQSGAKREDLFITTKISIENFGSKHTPASFAHSLEYLQTDYVDLLLLHFPVPLLRERAWKAVEEIHDNGKARAIGVSNYTVRHLKEMKKYASLKPAVNQVELHVFLQQPELLDYCHEQGIQIEAYSPLAHAREMDDPVIIELAKKHSKSYAQIMLRWCLQKDLVVLPKSVTPERIRQNIEIFDFELDAVDMEKLAACDKNMRTCWSPVHIP